MSETWTRDGGRRIELFVPVEFIKQKIDAVIIKPVKLDHFIRWQSGEISTALALLSELTGLQQVIHFECIFVRVPVPAADEQFAAIWRTAL